MFLHILILCCITTYSFTKNIPITILTEKYLNTLQVIEKNIQHSGRNSVINIVSDGYNNYILKQNKENNLDLIKEVIVSSIARQENIHVDKSYFIPYNIGQHIKIYPDQAATLHDIVPGTNLEAELPLFLSKNFKLSQRFRPYNWEYKHGFSEKYGLNEITLESMSYHLDLPCIVALDTFCGIDQGAAFSGELPFLPLLGYQQIFKLEYNDYFEKQTNPNIFKSLQLYQQTLKMLCQNYSSDDILEQFHRLIPFFVNPETTNTNYLYKIDNLKFYINETSHQCFMIVALIDRIINKINNTH
ncbi:MAG: hypothetical protein ACXWL5_00610 [Candidatus Chromulinivorax sp.]